MKHEMHTCCKWSLWLVSIYGNKSMGMYTSNGVQREIEE